VFLTLDLMLDLAIFELTKIFEKQNPKFKNKTISLITFLEFLEINKNNLSNNIKTDNDSLDKILFDD